MSVELTCPVVAAADVEVGWSAAAAVAAAVDVEKAVVVMVAWWPVWLEVDRLAVFAMSVGVWAGMAKGTAYWQRSVVVCTLCGCQQQSGAARDGETEKARGNDRVLNE